MREAIRVARESNGALIGAVVVRNDHLVAEGRSTVAPQCDPTAHAEIVAIRTAASKLGKFHLSDCTLYCTLEPCGMCLSACAWASLRAVVFGADYTTTPDEYYEQLGYSAVRGR